MCSSLGRRTDSARAPIARRPRSFDTQQEQRTLFLSTLNRFRVGVRVCIVFGRRQECGSSDSHQVREFQHTAKLGTTLFSSLSFCGAMCAGFGQRSCGTSLSPAIEPGKGVSGQHDNRERPFLFATLPGWHVPPRHLRVEQVFAPNN